MRRPFEDRIFADQEKTEKEALRLYGASPKRARAFLTGYCRGLMEQVPPLYIRMRERLLTLFTNDRE